MSFNLAVGIFCMGTGFLLLNFSRKSRTEGFVVIWGLINLILGFINLMFV